MSKTWAAGSTRRWRGIRAYVLQRDGQRCRAHADGWCDRVPGDRTHRCTGRATHAHHTHGRAVTGDDPLYVVAACAACNLFIGDPTAHNPAPTTRTAW